MIRSDTLEIHSCIRCLDLILLCLDCEAVPVCILLMEGRRSHRSRLLQSLHRNLARTFAEQRFLAETHLSPHGCLLWRPPERGADLTLTDLAWADGKSNYFGRVWIAKSVSLNRVPDLIVPNRAKAILDQLVEIPISATDADGQPITLKLDRGVDFATLLDYGDGRGMLRLALSEADVHPCLYRVRLLATDSGNPPLSDAATIELTLGRYPIFLPFLSRSW